ncbi:hypothetical protein MSR1_26120 [Magnetospirillum gryphiswaldense MSR-1]|nr:hypothetical protein MSR1_26120 [Magnetospirillum gryphiswaldense MSR-1]AVM78995.1 hypothetical protein MSR1L_26120 [Magnetospirillum gryphiswaldense]
MTSRQPLFFIISRTGATTANALAYIQIGDDHAHVAVIKQYGTADGANLLNDGYGDVHRHDMTVAVYKKNGVVLAHPRKGLVGRDLSDNRGDDIHCERLAEVDVCAVSAKR